MRSPLALCFFRFSKSRDHGLKRRCVRLWRRAHFSMVQCRVIIALILVQVCDGGYGKNVMKKWGA